MVAYTVDADCTADILKIFTVYKALKLETVKFSKMLGVLGAITPKYDQDLDATITHSVK
jgi:hypothetical protein